MARSLQPLIDSGRLGYREPDEPPDERPCIVRAPFWRDKSEQLTYEHAVQSNPRKSGEGPMAYIQRIAELVKGKLQGVQSMPKVEREEWWDK